MNLLYSDDCFVIAQKPAGVLSQGADRAPNGDNMLSLLEKELGGTVYPVHRLDRETAGVMVFARTKESAAALSASIQSEEWKKEYFAVLSGVPEHSSGTLSDLLFFDRAKNKAFPVKRMRNGVKKALLSYELLETQGPFSLVKVFPVTGRTHQIRVQFASRRHPLYGDRKYGGQGEALGLFCHRLSFPHPKDQTPCSFCAFPADSLPWSLFSYFKEA
jgi:23S rRNA pseudouridine1911/1915/1917 synthase